MDLQRQRLDRITASLLGGAVGDALGYAVEFQRLREIRRRFGPDGITDFVLQDGKAIISDDTQMTIFTASGLLAGETARQIQGQTDAPIRWIYRAYLEWYATQRQDVTVEKPMTWLYNLPALHARRAPGNTCLAALGSGQAGTRWHPINHSKGCGGVMRVAPVAFVFTPEANLFQVMNLGADAAALTHGHPLGWLPAAALAGMIFQLIHQPGAELLAVAEDILTQMEAWYADIPSLEDFLALSRKAISLAGRSLPDDDAIRQLGEGWVAEETLAIALYAVLRYSGDFRKAMICAVNHDGDSDSTGAVAGNLLGALVGTKAVEAAFDLERLELAGVLRILAADLSRCPLTRQPDAAWLQEYGGI